MTEKKTLEKKLNIPYSKSLYPTPEDRIKYLVKSFFRTAGEFADCVGFDDSLVSNLIRHKKVASIKILQKICRALPDLSLQWLVTGEDEDMPLKITTIDLITEEEREEKSKDEQLARLRAKLEESEKTIETLKGIIDKLVDKMGK